MFSPGFGRLGTTTSYKLTDIKRFHKFHLVCSVSLALLVLQVSLLSLDSLQVFARGRPIRNIARGTILYFFVSRMVNIDDQYQNPNMNNKDYLVGRLTIIDLEY